MKGRCIELVGKVMKYTVQRCGTVRLIGASSGANLTKQELFNTELALAEY